MWYLTCNLYPLPRLMAQNEFALFDNLNQPQFLLFRPHCTPEIIQEQTAHIHVPMSSLASRSVFVATGDFVHLPDSLD